MVLRPGQRGEAALWGKGGPAAVAWEGVDGLGNRLGCGTPAEPPTGHAPSLGETVHDDGVLEVRRGEAGDALDGRAVVEQVLVDLVAHDEHALLHADVAEGFDFVGGIDRAGRVARGI